jgi:hypothetical protein
VNATVTRSVFRIMANGQMIAAAGTIDAIVESVRYFRPDVYQVEELIDVNRGAGRHMSRFWGWITHHYDGVVSVEPCLRVVEGRLSLSAVASFPYRVARLA